MKVRFDRFTINVKNLDEAKKFFSELLETTFEDLPEGAKLEITPAPDSFVKFRFAVSPLGIELFEPDPPVEKEGVRNITWRVDNIEEAKEKIMKRGVSHLFDAKCGYWKESVFSTDGMYGVRTVFNEYRGDSVIRAMLQE